MESRTVTIATPDGDMSAHLALPDGAELLSGPAVIVLQEAFGVDAHIRDVCGRFAAEGYAALAPELYHRAGDHVMLDHTDFAAVRPYLHDLTNAGIEADVDAAIRHLHGEPRVGLSPVAAVGFCVGGFAAFLAACRTRVAAAVCFYGGGIVRPRPGAKLTPLIDEAGRIRCPVLALFGQNDASIPPEDVRTIRGRLADLGKVAEVVVYPDAGHGFFNDRRDSYRAEAAADAWRRTLAFLPRLKD